MALHGDLSVNGERIGYWEAKRLQPFQPDRDTYSYECRVDRHRDGKIEMVQFVLDHNYSEGAEMLAAKVLLLAVQRRQHDAGT